MKNIPTAEELAIKTLLKGSTEYSSFDRVCFTGKQLKELADEFAKLHVQEALKGVSKAEVSPTEDQIINTIISCVDIRGIDLVDYKREFTDERSGLITALRKLFSNG